MPKYRVAAKMTVERPGRPKSRKNVETLIEAETRESAIAFAKLQWVSGIETLNRPPSFSRVEASRIDSPASFAKPRAQTKKSGARR